MIHDSYFLHNHSGQSYLLNAVIHLISSGLIPRPLGGKLVENQQLEERI